LVNKPSFSFLTIIFLLDSKWYSSTFS
jgi:hypothetical protein